jgi:hypothetical protein
MFLRVFVTTFPVAGATGGFVDKSLACGRNRLSMIFFQGFALLIQLKMGKQPDGTVQQQQKGQATSDDFDDFILEGIYPSHPFLLFLLISLHSLH